MRSFSIDHTSTSKSCQSRWSQSWEQCFSGLFQSTLDWRRRKQEERFRSTMLLSRRVSDCGHNVIAVIEVESFSVLPHVAKNNWSGLRWCVHPNSLSLEVVTSSSVDLQIMESYVSRFYGSSHCQRSSSSISHPINILLDQTWILVIICILAFIWCIRWFMVYSPC